jgi:hypothetical protein
MRALLSFAFLLTVIACAPTVVDWAPTPPAAVGLGDDNNAIQYSQWAFAVASRTHNLPWEAAKAVASVDYLAGALNMSPRWAGVAPFAKIYMLEARTDVRHVLGIAPNAPSQAVVNTMQQVALSLQAGDQPAAFAALAPPIYTLPPEQTVAILANMPFVRSANLATQFAAQDLGAPGNSEMRRRH